MYLKFIFLWKVFESRSDFDKIGKALAPFLLIPRTIWRKREQRVLLKDLMIKCSKCSLGSPNSLHFLVEQVGDFGIRRRQKKNAEKYKSRAF